MHTDEAVNAYIVGQLLAGEPFIYDPQDRHGPALAALALPMARMQGARSFSDLTESEFGSYSVVAGTITILLFGCCCLKCSASCPSLLAAILFASRRCLSTTTGTSSMNHFLRSDVRADPVWLARIETRSARQAALAGACAASDARLQGDGDSFTSSLWPLPLCSDQKPARQQVERRFGVRGADACRACHFSALSAILVHLVRQKLESLPALSHAAPNFFARAAGQGHRSPSGISAGF